MPNNNTFSTSPQEYGAALMNIINVYQGRGVLNGEISESLVSLSNRIIGLNTIRDNSLVIFWINSLNHRLCRGDFSVHNIQGYINQIWQAASEPTDNNIVVQHLTETVDQDSLNDVYTKDLFGFANQEKSSIGDLPDSYSIFLNSFISVFEGF